MTKHLESIHYDQFEVQEAKVLPLGSPQRATALMKIRNLGNYRHNLKVNFHCKTEFVLSDDDIYVSHLMVTILGPCNSSK